MSAATAKGYPYPLGTDPMSDADAVMQALATAIDTKLGARASGTVTFTRFATVNPDAITVTYPVGRFTGADTVYVAVTGQTTNPMALRVTLSAATPTGVTLNCWRESGVTNTVVYWVANQFL